MIPYWKYWLGVACGLVLAWCYQVIGSPLGEAICTFGIIFVGLVIVAFSEKSGA